MSGNSYEDDLRKEMQAASDESVTETDELKAAELEKLITVTTADLEVLRPKVTDPAVLDSLISVVESATTGNVNLAELKSRLQEMGSLSIQTVRQIIKLLP